MRHTPGPWAVDNADPYLVTADGDGLMVAVTENDDRQDDEEAEANAHLIAAAPGLLDVAQAVVTAFGDLILPSFIERHLLEGARKAISQAEGGAQ